MIRNALFLAVAALTISCGGASTQTPNTPPILHPTAGKVDVAIASVTLADDCGTAPTAVPPSPMMQQPAEGARASMTQSGDRACEQSSVQLRIANGTTAATPITIKKIELLDDSGTVIGELQSREPSQWTADTYQPWDQQLAPDQVLQVSYALSAPAVFPGNTYTVRVTVAAGDGERTLEQRTTVEAEASLPPGAVT